ncbi:MAG: MFS transporter [Halolamina sp.]|uniref:MFS transporter n=1 Tax=Halolamina sp. TaxID=1940283 RepID=UPI002FC2BA19
MPSRVVTKFYLLQATRSVGFISPIFTLFLLRSLNFTQIGVLSALSAALVVAGEVPTGYVGDWLGRRASIAISIGLKAISLAGFVVAQSFWAYAVLYVPWAIGMTFASGSVDAWLYDTLDERLDTDAFTRVRGRGAAVMQWTSVATAIGGGLLYAFRPTWPFIASFGLNVLGLGVLFSLPANRAYRETGEHDRVGPAARDTFAVLKRAVATPKLRSFVLYVALFFGVVSASTTYVQPVAEALFASAGSGGASAALSRVGGAAGPLAAVFPEGVSVGVGLGLLYAGFTGVSAVASQYAGPLEDRFGVRPLLVAVPVVTAVLLVLPRLVLVLALPLFVAQRAARSLLLPMVNNQVSGAVDDSGRATVLSSVSLLVRLWKLPLAVGAGVLADTAGTDAAGSVSAVGETTALAALGGLFLLVTLGVVLAGRSVRGLAPSGVQ